MRNMQNMLFNVVLLLATDDVPAPTLHHYSIIFMSVFYIRILIEDGSMKYSADVKYFIITVTS